MSDQDGGLPVRIAGAGFYLPQRRVTSAELEVQLGLQSGWIERVTGVRERRRVAAETSAEMGAAAGRMALEQAGFEPASLDLIVGGSAAPQQAIPCTAVFVQRELGLAESAPFCFDVNATCLSFGVALETAAHFIAAGRYQRALVYSSEITSWSLNYGEPESAVLFGDAAAAVVLERTAPGGESRLLHAQFRTDSRGAELTQLRGGGTRHHANDPATTPVMNTFSMDGRGVFRLATQMFGPVLGEVLERVGWRREDVDAVIPHQASQHAVELLWRRYGFSREQAVINLAERGNCLAASTPLALAEAIHSGRVQRGHRVVLAGTGAGVSVGVLALRY